MMECLPPRTTVWEIASQPWSGGRPAGFGAILLGVCLLAPSIPPASGRAESPKPKQKEAGDGKKAADAKIVLTDREKRMLRWHIKFPAKTGPEYLAQLHGLGAILAIPVEEEKGKDPIYKVIRDLRPGKGVLKDDDLSKIVRIYWIEDKESSVKDVMDALGLRLPKTPSRFVAFMPDKLEDQLIELERHHIEKVLRKPYDVKRIEETVFRTVTAQVDGKDTVKVELVSVTMKR